MFDMVACLVLKDAKKTKHIRHALQSNFVNIDETYLAAAKKIHTRNILLLQDFEQGGEVPGGCAIWDQSEEKRSIDAGARRANEALIQRLIGSKRSAPAALGIMPDKDKKRQTTVEQISKKAGDLIYSAAMNIRMPTPTLTNTAKPPCAGFLREGAAC